MGYTYKNSNNWESKEEVVICSECGILNTDTDVDWEDYVKAHWKDHDKKEHNILLIKTKTTAIVLDKVD